jgi:hypothetical protein
VVTNVPSFTVNVDPASPLAIGPHVYQLVVVDDSGNVSAPAAATVRVADNAAPTAVLDAPTTVPLGQSFTLSGARSSDIGGQVVEWRWTPLDTNVPVVTNVPSFTVNVDPASPLAIGPHVYQLVVVDDSGNQSSPVLAAVSVVGGGPAIESIAPPSAPGGTLVTITGTGFNGVTAVRFGGSPTLFAVMSPTQIRALVPLGAGSGPVTVTTSAGIASSNGVYSIPPRVLGILPGTARVGATVVITGTNLVNVTEVLFNGVAASFSEESPLHLRAIVPAGATNGPITVTTAGGSDQSGTFRVKR